jgi:hypothetical protein
MRSLSPSSTHDTCASLCHFHRSDGLYRVASRLKSNISRRISLGSVSIKGNGPPGAVPREASTVSHHFRWCNSAGYLFPFSCGAYARSTEHVSSFLPRARHEISLAANPRFPCHWPEQTQLLEGVPRFRHPRGLRFYCLVALHSGLCLTFVKFIPSANNKAKKV